MNYLAVALIVDFLYFHMLWANLVKIMPFEDKNYPRPTVSGCLSFFLVNTVWL